MKEEIQDQQVQIILSESSHAKRFETGKLVHSSEYKNAIVIIDSLLPKKLEENSNKYLHNTITIFGTRGSGKTSFLLSLKDFYEKRPGVAVLEIIDPTLIEEKGHVFLNVIAAITEQVNKKLAINESNDVNRAIRRDWREKMLTLAAGLPSIDGMSANTDNWQDPEFVLDKGLTAVGSALNLVGNFDTFLSASLKILEKYSFMLIFDDIDVDANKGWAVLETIRKYFTTSRLITILSGDLQLYSMVVRQQKWKNFGPEILKYEGERQKKLEQFNNMVTALESQYLQKIMQPKYRIHLLSLLEKRRINQLPSIFIRENGSSSANPKELINLYREIFKNFGIRNLTQAEVFITYLLGNPLRTQIQFITIMCSFIGSENAHERQTNEQITDIFLADLLEYGIDVNLINGTSKYLNTIILELLIKTAQLKDLYQLQPSTTDSSLNACLIALNMILASAFRSQKLSLVFDYQIKIGYIRNLMDILPLTPVRANQASITDLSQTTGMLKDGILRDLTGKLNAYLLGYHESVGLNRSVTGSYITLYGLNGPANRKTTNRLDYVFADDGSANSILAYIPSYSSTYSYKNNSSVNYSIYMVIATLGELLRIYEDRANDGDETLESVKSALNEFSQHRSYPAPDFRLGRNNVEQRNESEPGEEDETDLSEINQKLLNKSGEILAKNILKWMAGAPKSIQLAPHLLGKISTRAYFAIQNIVERKPSYMLLGELFHYQMIAFLNATLIEDVRENLMDSSHLNINNTSFSDRVLINNLKNTIDKKLTINENAALSYSKWLLACPILRGYLKKESTSQLIEFLNNYSGGYASTDNETEQFSIADQLDKVSIYGSIIRTKEESIAEQSGDYSYLAEKGRETELIEIVKRSRIGLNLLRENNNIGIITKRNQALKELVPGLFEHNASYSEKMLGLRKRLKKLGLT